MSTLILFRINWIKFIKKNMKLQDGVMNTINLKCEDSQNVVTLKDKKNKNNTRDVLLSMPLEQKR